MAHMIFDHLALCADELASGARHAASILGVDVPIGGTHPRMGTHNRVMNMGAGEFFEIIARDPKSAPLEQPRWFRLDYPQGTPHIGNWICRCDDLDAALARLPPSVGRAMVMTRGTMRWRIAVPDDGGLPFDGGFPTLIEWPQGPLPADAMPDLGCRMTGLTITHPNAEMIAARLDGLLSDARIRFHQGPALAITATLATPQGPREI